MITKLVIVRKKYVHPEVLSDFSAFIAGEVLKVSPVAWGDEAGLTHWGWMLEGMKVGDLEKLRAWDVAFGHSTILSLGDKKQPISVDEALASVGLRINPSA